MPVTVPATDSLAKIFQTIRARVLAFETLSGETVGDDVEARFYYASAPSPGPTTYPCLVGRLINQQITPGLARLRADLELMVYDRPRARQLAAATIADRVTAALLSYRDGSSGFLLVTPRSRDSLEPTPPPGDRELVQIRMTFEVIAYPALLSQYAVPG
jgi:hypothetical protein